MGFPYGGVPILLKRGEMNEPDIMNLWIGEWIGSHISNISNIMNPWIGEWIGSHRQRGHSSQ